MGLGSFVKKRLLGQGGENEDDDNVNSVRTPPPTKSSGIEQSPAIQRQMEKIEPPDVPSARTPLQTKGVVTSSPPRVSYPGVESAQDRINRVKQGKMTDEEKQKFLASTLKNVGAVSTSSRTKGSNPPPVRQPLLDDTALIKRGPRTSATPYPKDSMLREVVSGRRDQKSIDEWTLSNKQKKEYFDMVTNPNRFNSFNTQGSTVTSPPPPSLATDYPVNEDPPPSLIPWETALPTNGASSGLTNTPSVPPSAPTFDPSDSNHLGARLEAAAMAEEQRQREVRRAVEMQREEELRRHAEMLRAREEEMRERELEALRRKEEALELARQQEAFQREQERLRQEQMMKAQEEYWANKLKAERQRKLQKLGEQEQFAQQSIADEDDSQQDQPDWDSERGSTQDDNQLASYEPIVPTPPPAAPAFPSPKWQSASVATSTRRQFPLQRTTNPFLDQQAAKRAEIERAKEEQLAKLKALNSPLPSGPPQGLVPAMAPVKRPPINSMPLSQAPGMKRTTHYSPPTPTPMRGLSELQRLVNQNSEANDVMVTPQNTIYQDSRNPPPPPAASSSAEKSVGGNGFMGRIFGGQDEPMQKIPPQEQQRKVVRQALPLVDEDDEFEAFSRNGPNKNMSIKDALRKSDDGGILSKDDQESKSKMWGVDMSRFND